MFREAGPEHADGNSIIMETEKKNKTKNKTLHFLLMTIPILSAINHIGVFIRKGFKTQRPAWIEKLYKERSGGYEPWKDQK